MFLLLTLNGQLFTSQREKDITLSLNYIFGESIKCGTNDDIAVIK